MKPTIEQCINAYRKHQHLKNAAEELGIKWQTLYVRLKKANEPVIGNKLKYGSKSDKVGAKGEMLFQSLVPNAEDQNSVKFQAKCDFLVGDLKVEVKSSYAKESNKRTKSKRWSFSLKKQEMLADVFVLFAFNDDDSLAHAFLVPSEIARYLQTVSISASGRSKWMQYEIDEGDLSEFFNGLID